MPNLIWKGKKDLADELDYKNKVKHDLQSYRQKLGNLFEQYGSNSKKQSPAKDWKNILIYGPNKDVMKLLMNQFSEKINLIYIDPPFATGGNFNYKIYIGQRNHTTSAEAYSDTWKKGIDSYLSFLYERLLLMKKLLSESGSIYVQLDWHISHYMKVILDEIFGNENFRNEIIWSYPAASVQTRRFFIRSYDTILFYTKSEDFCFNDDPNIYMEYSDRVKNALKKDEHGIFYYRGGTHNGKKLSRKVYVREHGIFPRDVWNDIPYIRANTKEYQGFSTQKPERLLKRIILASTNENDLIADFFCGTGTTLVVAEKLNRRWIGCDIAKHAIHITRKRILNISNSNDLYRWNKEYNASYKPFEVVNIGGEEGNQLVIKPFLGQDFENELNFNFEKNPDFQIKLYKNRRKVWIELKDYKFPYMDFIKEDIKNQITSFHDLIDYWAIDFDYNDHFFNIDWCSYKTIKKRTLELISNPYSYENSKEYKIKVKIINIFGQEIVKNFFIKIE